MLLCWSIVLSVVARRAVLYLLLPLLYVLADGGCEKAVKEATFGVLRSMSGDNLQDRWIRGFSVLCAAAAEQQHACMEQAHVIPVPACAVSECVPATKVGTVTHPVCACLYLADEDFQKMSGKGVRKRVAEQLKCDAKRIKAGVERAIDEFIERRQCPGGQERGADAEAGM